MIGFTVFVYFQVPETKGKTIEEIAGKFAPSGDKIEVRPRSMKMCIFSVCYGKMQNYLYGNLYLNLMTNVKATHRSVPSKVKAT